MPSEPAIFARRRAGVLQHVSSLPGGHGIGDLGEAAHDFASWCAAAGLSIWQMLPVGPVGPGDSPYASTSSFAGEPLFVSLDALRAERLLTPAECAQRPRNSDRVDYPRARTFKIARLRLAFDAWTTKRGHRAHAYVAWHRSQLSWLRPWCTFMRAHGPAEFHSFVQWQFHRQWCDLRAHAARRGVLLMGDVPIFVPLVSADVQANPELFRLDARGRPTVVTGVPPDCFSSAGQRWGHPHYNWPQHKRTRFAWWVARVQHALTRFDALRVDHFVGFVHAYEIPGSARTARRGRWRPAPGRELLTALHRACGTLPLVAEDLGAVTPQVTALRKSFHLPGMRLVQNAFYGPGSADLPCNHPQVCVAYPGTHDNAPTAAWWRTLPAPARRRCAAYAGLKQAATPKAACHAAVRMTLQSPARTAVIPMQDFLASPAAARMNTPGVSNGQWRWRLTRAPRSLCAPASILGLAEATARA